MTTDSTDGTSAGIDAAGVAHIADLYAKAIPGRWRVGRQNGAPRDHLVDMGIPPKAPYFRMHKGAASINTAAFGIVEGDDVQDEQIAASAALIVALHTAAPALIALARQSLRPEPGAEVERLRRMLMKCAAQFRFYEQQHRAKGTPEANAEADANRDIASEIDATLVSAALEGSRTC